MVRLIRLRIIKVYVRVGIGSHIPEALDYVEEKGWDVDFIYDMLLQSVQIELREYLDCPF